MIGIENHRSERLRNWPKKSLWNRTKRVLLNPYIRVALIVLIAVVFFAPE